MRSHCAQDGPACHRARGGNKSYMKMASYIKNLVSRMLNRTPPGKHLKEFGSIESYISDLVSRMLDRTTLEKPIKGTEFTTITYPLLV